MNDFENYFDNNLKKIDGIWKLISDETAQVSYPVEEQNLYFSIEDRSFWFRHRVNCIKFLVKKFSSQNSLFFDVGGGNGFNSYVLQNEGYNVFLVEPGRQGSKNALSRGVKNIYCCVLKDVGASNVDAVGIFDVIEHLEDEIAFLSDIKAILRDDGLVYVTVPAFKLLWSLEDVSAGHFRRYTLSSLKKLFKENGFDVVYSNYFFAFLFPLVFLFRGLPFLLGMQKRDETNIAKMRQDHGEGFAAKTLAFFGRIELKLLKKGLKFPFGGSCILVVKKLKNK